MQPVPMEGDALVKVVEALGRTHLFGDLTDERLHQVAAVTQLQRYESDETIVRQGDPSDGFFLLLSGEGRVHLETSPGADPFELTTLRPPALVGEIGVLLEKPRSASVVAGTRTLALRFERTAFLRLMERVPEFALSVSRGLARRVDDLSRRVPAASAEAESRPLPEPSVVSLLPLPFIDRHRILPIAVDGRVLTLGFVDEPDPRLARLAQRMLPDWKLRIERITPSLFEDALMAWGNAAGTPGRTPGAPSRGREDRDAGPPTPSLAQILRRMVAEGATDLHLVTGARPRWRVGEEAREIAGAPELGRADVLALIDPLLDPDVRRRLNATGNLDEPMPVAGIGWFHLTVRRDDRGVRAVFRLFPAQATPAEQLI